MLKWSFNVISTEYGFSSESVLNHGKQSRNWGNIKENDFPGLADTLVYLNAVQDSSE